jgi:hypothetical protein
MLCPPSIPRPSSGVRYGDHQDHALGFRRHDHIFTIHDYNSYVATRLEFFKQPHVRTASGKGGIVGRLAGESIPQDVLLLGPALEDGHISKVSLNGRELWGDMLSDRDLDLICGVYNVEQNSGRISATQSQLFFLHYRFQVDEISLPIHHGFQSTVHGFGVA